MQMGLHLQEKIVVSNESGEVVLNQAFQATIWSTIETPPTRSVVIINLTTSMIDNMFICGTRSGGPKLVEEQVRDDTNQDQGILDVDFLEFNELEGDIDTYTEGETLDGTSRLDIDYLDVDFLTDVLDVVEELVKTIKLRDAQASVSDGTVQLQGATFGFNKIHSLISFEEDGNLVFYEVNGVIEIIIQNGNSGFFS